jgi:hypothetical protein
MTLGVLEYLPPPNLTQLCGIDSIVESDSTVGVEYIVEIELKDMGYIAGI